MLRYIHRLEAKDLSLTTSMIPLGSCTMKLNATVEMIPVTWPEFGALHPYAPADQAAGYAMLFEQLETWLGQITGLPGRLPAAERRLPGRVRGPARDPSRPYCAGGGRAGRVPDPGLGPRHERLERGDRGLSAASPSSATTAATSTSPICASVSSEHRDALGALMITYPSTHGVFEERIREICGIVHEAGGQVYMDGANMNAQVGLTSPAEIGADVCHLNLHKTFSIPARRRRSGHGADLRGRASARLPAGPSRLRRRRGLRGALRQPLDPADLLGLHRADGGRRPHSRDPDRDPERELHGPTPRGPLRRALHGPRRPRRPRVHHRLPPLRTQPPTSRSRTSRSA